MTTEEFVKISKSIHGDKYDYSKVIYKNSVAKVKIGCPNHGWFLQAPQNHRKGTGCPRCKVGIAWSKIAIKWLEEYAHTHRMKNIEHGSNVGEYILPGTRIRVDGYHARSNTVFEFHGDLFHGNPKVYSPRSKPNPYNNKTAQRMYKETKARERLIRKLGYNLITMWESDYKGGEKPKHYKPLT